MLLEEYSEDLENVWCLKVKLETNDYNLKVGFVDDEVDIQDGAKIVSCPDL